MHGLHRCSSSGKAQSEGRHWQNLSLPGCRNMLSGVQEPGAWVWRGKG